MTLKHFQLMRKAIEDIVGRRLVYGKLAYLAYASNDAYANETYVGDYVFDVYIYPKDEEENLPATLEIDYKHVNDIGNPKINWSSVSFELEDS